MHLARHHRWFADEATPATDAVLAQVVAKGAIVERRKRIAPALVDRMLDILAGLPIEVEPPLRMPQRAVDLARAHRLTVYDALYLETAIRRGLPLATLDRDLRKAARAAGVEVL